MSLRATALQTTADHFAARGGLALLHRSWRPASPRGTLALVHGLAEHCGRYEHVAHAFAERGFSVHAYDQRGHGQSEGPRAYTPSFEALLDDLQSYLEHVRRSDPEGPLVLLGHSMGGLEVASLLVRRKPTVDVAILSGPALAPPAVPGLQRMALQVLSRIGPRLRIPSSIDPEGLSIDPEVVQAYIADPLVDKRYTARLITELIAAMRAIEGRAAAIEVPLLIVHGEADPICDVEASRRFAAALTRPGSELKTYPELRHEVLNEPQRGRVFDDISTWLEKHLPAVAR